MPTRLSFLLAATVSLILPLCAHAAEGTTTTAEVTADTEIVAPALESPGQDKEVALEDLLGPADEPMSLCSSGYSCPFCPDFRDLPPATCVNGCCVYESSCQSTCNFDSDCGPLASCWSGCCYSWQH